MDAESVWESEGGALPEAPQSRWVDVTTGLRAWLLPCPLVRCDRCQCPTNAADMAVRSQRGQRLPGWWCMPCIRRFWS